MNNYTVYMDTPNGERIEVPATMPDVEEVPEPLCDGKFELQEAIKEILKWADEVAKGWSSNSYSFECWLEPRRRINFNPPERWEAVQDKRRNTSPLGRCSYLHKARKVKSLARSVHTQIAPHRGAKKTGVEQCKHTFKITAARCAPCSGYNVECKHYEKNDAADTKHSSSLA